MSRRSLVALWAVYILTVCGLSLGYAATFGNLGRRIAKLDHS